MSGWEGYIYQIQNKYNPDTQQYTVTNMCQHAAIYGTDGTPWAASAGFALNKVTFDMEQEDGTKKPVPVDEFVCALEATKGNRKGSEAGIRMNGQKYMMIRHNPESNSVYLSREGGGGACVARTSSAVVIGIWDKTAKMSNDKLQNNGDCNELVEKMGEYLKANGY